MNVDIAFCPANLSTMKKLFEGMGACIRPDLYLKYKPLHWKGCIFFLASNKLPMSEKALKEKEGESYKDQWEPIEARTYFVRMDTSH